MLLHIHDSKTVAPINSINGVMHMQVWRFPSLSIILHHQVIK